MATKWWHRDVKSFGGSVIVAFAGIAGAVMGVAFVGEVWAWMHRLEDPTTAQFFLAALLFLISIPLGALLGIAAAYYLIDCYYRWQEKKVELLPMGKDEQK